ncbi:MAG TPA: glycogen debranching protein GlgX, partial [Mycobacterium sp.]|nr:glycogen debranching protein GlgX [Mycobacterium sp.]
HRSNPHKLLLDPYAKNITGPLRWSDALFGYTVGHRRGDLSFDRRDSARGMPKCKVIDPAFSWGDDRRPNVPWSEMVIYETHVRGFTRLHPDVPAPLRGTYAGLACAGVVEYLRALGVTTVELMPVQAVVDDRHLVERALANYWGYNSIGFFAPDMRYSATNDVTGFKTMVKRLHRAGLEVILDVVFNHTAEVGEDGPTLGLRGIDNPTYYILEQGGARYADYSGCGNTLNANHPVVRRMIVDSLRYWVSEMHVDGFRFDLASILSRDSKGHVLPNPPVLWDIETDPALAGTKLIAEAWDAAGLYQVGTFVGDAWKEWNGRFRDDCRDVFRGAPGAMGRFADRLLGSPEVYGHKGREAEQSVNFVTCHDGFTLNDLVSYERKHNEANGENNRDGADDNRSWNCGLEGPSDDPAVEALRNRQVKNFLTVTMLALGVPMILMGDEVRRTQRGNNNAYCHDDESTWFDWSLLDKHADVHRFVTLLTARRLLRDVEHEERRLSLTQLIAAADKSWHGVRLGQPDWGEHSHSIAFTARLRAEQMSVHLILNAFWESLEFELPPIAGTWQRWIDTSLQVPEDIVEWQKAPAFPGSTYRAGPRSVVVLYAVSG